MTAALNLALYGVPFSGNAIAEPTRVSASQTGGTPGAWTVELTFTAPDPPPDSYTIEQQVDFSGYSAASPDSVAGTTYTFTGLVDAIYQYRVRANYSEGSSSFVTSNQVLAFINLYLRFDNRYHAIAGI